MNLTTLAQVLTVAAALLATGAPAAQGLVDPTRPPHLGAVPMKTGAQGDGPPGAYRLESVILSAGRKLAVINGTTVPLGGKIGDGRLVRVSESGVAIQSGDAIETLRFHAGLEKKPVRARVAPLDRPRAGSDRARREEKR
jgi:MSHA biogenesis protein MshK